MKKFKGFTLIELIVVIAIIGVLAAILVPAMMGWVFKSRITTYNSNSTEVCTQLQTYLTDLDTVGELSVLRNCIVVCDDGDFSNTSPAPAPGSREAEALTALNGNLTDMTGVTWAARIVAGEVRAVALTGNDGGCVGGFPVQCPREGSFRMPKGADIADYLDCAEGVGTQTWKDKIVQ